MDNLNPNPEGHNKEAVSPFCTPQSTQVNQQLLNNTEEKEEKFDILNCKLTRSQVSFDMLFYFYKQIARFRKNNQLIFLINLIIKLKYN